MRSSSTPASERRVAACAAPSRPTPSNPRRILRDLRSPESPSDASVRTYGCAHTGVARASMRASPRIVHTRSPVRLAAAPISWGVCEVPGWGFQMARDRVLEDAIRLDLREIEAGPPGFLPADARAAREIVSRRGVRIIGGFVTVVLHRADRLDAELAALERQSAWLAGLGSEVLVLAAASGRDDYDARAELSGDEWRTLLDALPRATAAVRRSGLD